MIKRTDKITIVGMSGCGKTMLSKKLHGSGLWPRVVVFDRMGEYDPRDFTFCVRSFDQFVAVALDAECLDHFRLLYRFNVESDSKDKEFNEALRILYYMGDVLAVVEETWNYSTKHYLPKWYREWLLTGRHRGNGLISTSQRCAEINTTLVSMSQHVFCGQAFEKNDKKYLASFIGDENADRLSSLKLGDFLHHEFLPTGGTKTTIVCNK